MTKVWPSVAEAYQDNIMALTPEQIARIRGAAFGQNQAPAGGAISTPGGVRGLSSSWDNNSKIDGMPSPKASAAPVAGKENLFTGLCDALNQFQLELVKLKQRSIPDQYVIEFAPAALGESAIKRPGDQNKAQAPMQNNATAKKLDNAVTKLNTDAMTWPVSAGSQIVQVIDNVMRVSSFITDQQIVQISPVPDPVTGVQKQVSSPGTSKPMAWF